MGKWGIEGKSLLHAIILEKSPAKIDYLEAKRIRHDDGYPTKDEKVTREVLLEVKSPPDLSFNEYKYTDFQTEMDLK